MIEDRRTPRTRKVPLSQACVFAWIVVTLLAAAPATLAADEEGWDFDLTLYMLGAAQSGSNTIRGIEAEVDLSFSEIWSNLEIGGMFRFRAEGDRWLVQLDTIYMQLAADLENVTGSIDFDQTAIELAGGYRLKPRLDLLVGGRYNRIGGGVTTNIMMERRIDGSETWVDPFVGIAWNPSLSAKWEARLRADIGGFDVGSDLAWQLSALLNWDFARRWSLEFGYRILDMDYSTGSGNELFRYDVASEGPQAGVTFRF